jgi:hypothetical protein
MTMRSTSLMLCLGALAALPPVAWSQTTDTKPKIMKAEVVRDDENLAGLLEQAIKNNPDIRVAEVKLQQAEVELNRARMAAMHKIVVLQSELRSARAELAETEKSYKRSKELSAAGGTSAAELGQAALAVMSAKEKVARLEAEQPYLLGKAPVAAGMTRTLTIGDVLYRQVSGGSGMGSAATGPMPTAFWTDHYAVLHTLPQGKTEKLRALLKSPVKWPSRPSGSLRNIVDDLRTFVPGFAFEIMTSEPGGPKESKELPGPAFSGELPLHAVIQWIEDRYEVKFVVRDYGIVVADRDRLPPGAVALLDLAREPQLQVPVRPPVPAGPSFPPPQ